MDKLKIVSEVNISPELMAKVFWNMGSDEQAEFFECLHDIVKENRKTNPDAYSLGEKQWLYMRDEIRERGQKANDMYLAFSAFAYDYWPQKAVV